MKATQTAASTAATLQRSAEASAALRRLFAWIESRFGGLPLDRNERQAEILVRDMCLQRSDVERLARHECTAIHVKGFYQKNSAQKLGQQLAQEAAAQSQNWKISTSRGLESSDVATLGRHPPFNVAAGSGKMDAYFDAVLPEMEARRKCDDVPVLWPLDLLRLRLDEVWPGGARLARDEQQQRPFSGGLPRVMKSPTRWKHGYIHVDEMGPLDPRQGLLSANIYLQMPNFDATNVDIAPPPTPAMHIWPLNIRSKWDWYRNALTLSGLSSQDAEDQVRLRHKLGPPLEIMVTPGDLILLCVQRPHAAIGFAAGTRVSLQCFIQHHGSDKSLLIDS